MFMYIYVYTHTYSHNAVFTRCMLHHVETPPARSIRVRQ